ncbi:hypothetical protein KIV45_15730 [Janthinobacterium lividum]|nr:hypothetical protein KIV45_15730 [Janthinobacterium lividum]
MGWIGDHVIIFLFCNNGQNMAAEEPAIRFGEWLTIVAVLAGPILAVQAQKWVERRQAKKE